MTEPRFKSREEYQAWKAAGSPEAKPLTREERYAAWRAQGANDPPPPTMKNTDLVFEHPTNGYRESSSIPGLWTFLFGPFYFASKGIWGHAVLSAICAVCTFGIAWLFYPFFARGIVRKHYLQRGWTERTSG